MARYSSRENDPLTNWNGFPIFLTTILTALLVLGLAATAVLAAIDPTLPRLFIFFLPGYALTPLTAILYPFIGQISFFTPFGIIFFYFLALGIETHLGRRRLARLLILLTLVPALIGTISHFVFGHFVILSGNYLIASGLLIAFATLYPNADFSGWIPFKWIAFACLVAGSLMDLSQHQWRDLISLWGCAAGAFLYVRHCQERESDDFVSVGSRIRDWFRRKPAIRVLPPPAQSNRSTPLRGIADESDIEVDALLDKIAKSGLSSLSNAERAKLERARQELLKKERA